MTDHRQQSLQRFTLSVVERHGPLMMSDLLDRLSSHDRRRVEAAIWKLFLDGRVSFGYDGVSLATNEAKGRSN